MHVVKVGILSMINVHGCSKSTLVDLMHGRCCRMHKLVWCTFEQVHQWRASLVVAMSN